MKAVLVIDMPETCLQCPFTPICSFDKRNAVRIIRGEGTRGRLSECPLKPMPERKDTSDRKITYEELKERYGWNDCLKEIEGD